MRVVTAQRQEMLLDSSAVSCSEIREAKHSQSTALTSANPQLQAEVFVSTAALEIACQQWSIKKKKQGIMLFFFLVVLMRGQSFHTSSRGRCMNMNESKWEELCRGGEFNDQVEDRYVMVQGHRLELSL